MMKMEKKWYFFSLFSSGVDTLISSVSGPIAKPKYNQSLYFNCLTSKIYRTSAIDMQLI